MGRTDLSTCWVGTACWVRAGPGAIHKSSEKHATLAVTWCVFRAQCVEDFSSSQPVGRGPIRVVSSFSSPLEEKLFPQSN